jgi:hypothetical protein
MKTNAEIKEGNQQKQPTVSGHVETVVSWIRPSELLLGYTEFNKAIKGRELDANTKRWLGEWSSWDLACSPMDDNERSFIRYGHYLGFFSSISN